MSVANPGSRIREVCQDILVHVAFVQKVHVVHQSRWRMLDHIVIDLQIIARIEQVRVVHSNTVHDHREYEVEFVYLVCVLSVLEVVVRFIFNVLGDGHEWNIGGILLAALHKDREGR